MSPTFAAGSEQKVEAPPDQEVDKRQQQLLRQIGELTIPLTSSDGQKIQSPAAKLTGQHEPRVATFTVVNNDGNRMLGRQVAKINYRLYLSSEGLGCLRKRWFKDDEVHLYELETLGIICSVNMLQDTLDTLNEWLANYDRLYLPR
jgi:hypothetical protein